MIGLLALHKTERPRGQAQVPSLSGRSFATPAYDFYYRILKLLVVFEAF
jgi:hypothetical protein